MSTRGALRALRFNTMDIWLTLSLFGSDPDNGRLLPGGDQYLYMSSIQQEEEYVMKVWL